jgi:RimJ/RimL family protein N-acetyltransferase
LVGGCNIALSSDEAEIGWIMHRDFWGNGYGTEMGKEMLRFGFDELSLRRIIAHCDAENIGSYRVMEKIGMRREGLFIEGRPSHKQSDRKYSDELSYAILKDEWETSKEIAYYKTLPIIFNDFIELPELSDGVIHLVCTAKKPANPEKKYCPAYDFAICKGSEKIGAINLRIGYSGFGPDESSLYYGGQIGYNVDEKYRGNCYAGRACRLLLPVAKAHGMIKLLITNNVTNAASRRVCEKLGLRLIRTVRLPEWSDLYKDGQRYSNLFEWSIE